MICENIFTTPSRPNCWRLCIQSTLNYVNIFSKIINHEGHLNNFIGSKVTAILVNGVFFASRWSCIGKGLHLQPAQQVFFFSFFNISFFSFHQLNKWKLIIYFSSSCDLWYVTHYMWHVTSNTRRVTCDMLYEVNILSQFQDPSSYGVRVKVFWRFWGK